MTKEGEASESEKERSAPKQGEKTLTKETMPTLGATGPFWEKKGGRINVS